MIKVNDVMVGNLLKWKSYANSGISKVVLIENRPEHKTAFRTPLFQLESGACDHECDGVLLDDEWFKKLAFCKNKANVPITYIKIGMDDFRVTTHKEGFIFDGWGSFPFKYVYQLQNIYKSITGVELTVA